VEGSKAAQTATVEEVATGVPGFSGLRPVVRVPASPDESAAAVEEDGTAWPWVALVIALAVALIALLGGVLAWKLG
jgi:hypothetical protein